jgi:hypothetical protein
VPDDNISRVKKCKYKILQYEDLYIAALFFKSAGRAAS